MNLVVEYVPRSRIRPNPWNPNKQDEFIYAKELASIRAFGFVDPVLTRDAGDDFEIIDGEHRWRAAGELGIDPIPIVNLGEIGDTEARQLTIVLNETRGRPEPEKLRELLEDLSRRRPVQDLLEVLPYTREQFEALVKPFDWSSVEQPKQRIEEQWVLRSYKLPAEVAALLDGAIDRVQHEHDGGGRIPDWRALEFIVAEYLAE
jgi:hypothetical protein